MLTIFTGLMASAKESNMPLAVSVSTYSLVAYPKTNQVGTALVGFSIGWIELVAIVTAGLVVSPEEIGAAQGAFASIRAVGGAIAASIYVAVYSNKLTQELPAQIVPIVEAAGLPASSIAQLFAATANGTAAALNAVPGVNTNILAALSTGTGIGYTESFRIVFLASLSFGFVAILFAFFMTDIRHFLTDHINKTVVNNVKGRVDDTKV